MKIDNGTGIPSKEWEDIFPDFGFKVNKKDEGDEQDFLILEISKINYLASQSRIENVVEAANLLKEIGRFAANNGEEALDAQSNLRESQVKKILDMA